MADCRASDYRHTQTRLSEIIDRSEVIEFRFDGKTYRAHPGDTIGSALAAAGVKTLSRSFKYHRRRGLLCGAGHCPNCLVQIGNEPNVRSCQRDVEQDMDVRSQNAWPSLDRDIMALGENASRFMPVGFYYKTFIRPGFLWPFYERILRRVAGLGNASVGTKSEVREKTYLHADVVVIGGGPAGINAAQAAASMGSSVILCDDNQQMGGHLRHTGGGLAQYDGLASMIGELENAEKVRLCSGTAVTGWYEDNWLAACSDKRLYKIRAQAIIVATGGIHFPPVFANNDLPGVLLLSAAQRLFYLQGVIPGKRVVIATVDDEGWRLASDLQSVGVEIAAIADERQEIGTEVEELFKDLDIAIHRGYQLVAVTGKKTVETALLAQSNGEAAVAANPILVDCDSVVVNGRMAPANELLFMAGAQGHFNDDIGEFYLEKLPPGLFNSGRCRGLNDVSAQQTDGRQAGEAAAEYASSADRKSLKRWQGRASSSQYKFGRVSNALPFNKGKRFVCFCEDVTDEDIETAIAEGYDSVELLKRYSTVSMGPCQGKMCSINALEQAGRNLSCSVSDIGKTTSRPPIVPIPLAVLAGQQMEPVQVSPMHEWHVEKNAKMMVAGMWLRPEHYGSPIAEVQAVRNSVGIMDVSPLGKFQLTGPGVPNLLERLYVNQWHGLRRGRVRYGIMCNDEGVVIDDGVCARISEDEWFLSTTSTGASVVHEWIEWWRQSGWGDGVHLTDLTETYSAFNLAGPCSRAVLGKLTDRDLTNAKFPYMRVRSASVSGVVCRILRIGFTGELSYEIHCPAGYGRFLWDKLLEAGEEFGIRPFGVEAQRVLRLEKAHIIVGQDTDPMSDPISANLTEVVKLEKTDFLGKRALARIATEGPKQLLVGFKMESHKKVPVEGLQIVQADDNECPKTIGWVTSCRVSPTLDETIGLCWLPFDVASKPGAVFSIYFDGHLEEARVHHGPFYDPDGERLKS